MESLKYEARRRRSKAEGIKVCRIDIGWFVPFSRGGGVGNGG